MMCRGKMGEGGDRINLKKKNLLNMKIHESCGYVS
jgi:hypothetical protein